MAPKLAFFVFAALIGVSYGVQPSNYEISRKRVGGAGVGYGQYPGQYQGQRPGYYPGGNPWNNYVEGPPGAHPGCPLCDSSVYSYCSYKQAHDSCCCDSFQPNYHCRKTDCSFLHANSCQEYQLISNCCCIDLQKNAVVAPIVAVAPVVV